MHQQTQLISNATQEEVLSDKKDHCYIYENSIENIAGIFNEWKVKNILVFTGKGSFKLCGAQQKLDSLLQDFDLTFLQDFDENVSVEEIISGVHFLKENDFDAILAIGGGSVIDMAKSINLVSINFEIEELDKLWHPDLNKWLHNFNFRKGLPLVAVPTTAGTGSEVTQFATFYKKGIKHSFDHIHVLPDAVIIDPVFTHSLPQETVLFSGLDALSQAIESYWSIHSTVQSRLYAKKSIRLIVKNLDNAISEDPEARFAMHKGAYYSGKAINITRTTGAHAYSYALTSMFGIRHGYAVALLLPQFVLYNSRVTASNVTDARGVTFVRQIMQDIYDFFCCKDAAQVVSVLNGFLQKNNQSVSLGKLGIHSESDLECITSYVNIDRLRNNPRRVSAKSGYEIIKAIV